MPSTESASHELSEYTIGLCIPGIVITAFLLLGFAYTAWHPTSRRHLNRVSFRLLVCAMISNIIYISSFIVTPSLTGPSATCSFVSFTINTSLLFSACMFFCMSLNLQLVLVHGVDGRRMEKYYLIGSGILCAICNVTPLVAGKYGFVPGNDICWATNLNTQVDLRWLIGAQVFWILLMATLELVSFIVLATFMFQTQLRARRRLSDASAGSSERPTSTPPPIVLYRKIIFRIGLYPLCSCLLNFSSCILDLYLAQHSHRTLMANELGIVDLCLFSIRVLLYALLGATDPSFLRALRALREAEPSATPATTSVLNATQSFMSTRTKRFSFGTQALVRIELEHVADRPSVEARVASVEAESLERSSTAEREGRRADPEEAEGYGEDGDSIEYQI
ncbi:hypothetical protein DFH09DRAFT_1362517 [Mycena vulgaris]|nr:hypothetical protein DFH09DRAFT_1362517 [Mycena vulgaris]